MFNKVCEIIVTCNPNLDLLIANLSSGRDISDVLIVDNDSNNIMDLILLLNQLKVKIIRLSNNMGLAYAQNVGIKYAIDNEYTHVILFDQDSTIDNEFIGNLLSVENSLMKKGINVGAIGPLFYNPGNNRIYPATIFNGPFLKSKISLDNKIYLEATFLIASGCLIRILVLKDVGLMSDDLFIDYIDVDWSCRARKKGYKLYIASQAKMSHEVGDSRINVFGRNVSVHSPIRRYYLFRNFIYLMKCSHIPFGYKLREAFFNFARFVVAVIFLPNKKRSVYYVAWSVIDALSSNLGKCKH